MAEAQRISPATAREAISQNDALLICAYDEPAKYEKFRLDGSISMDELRGRMDGLEKDKELIFYCA